ncbi:arginine-hydroxylase NDUFAF5, mitochondrial-like [Uloborus diversus]|uniref:arginine-hydroxylase NDUFAF5, mitochondrial-like n=1 Tax=Uloborus diversus TaxID=327109 RepID=UPI00240A0ABF|nr:arginine-hydroxylase NDUFAF5, mitochondrial-like [Uloborus diversus]
MFFECLPIMLYRNSLCIGKMFQKSLALFFCRNKSDFSSSTLNIFDRKAKKIHRDWCAEHPDGYIYHYLKNEIGDRVADRVYDITRKFPICVELGCGKGHVVKHLTKENVEMVYLCDMSEKMVKSAATASDIPTCRLVVDEEFLPFANDSVDMFLSSLNFHWINDLPSTFQQIYDALKPDGVLIASMFGGDTLYELRSSLQLAETERDGGFSPHISPFARIRDIGDLLTRAGYSMLTIDTDEIKVNYPTMFELLEDLRGMGESNVSWNRKSHISRDSLLAAASIYTEMYGNEDKTVPATFEIIYLIGWKPHKSQSKPAKRGSGTVSMKSISELESKS